MPGVVIFNFKVLIAGLNTFAAISAITRRGVALFKQFMLIDNHHQTGGPDEHS